MLKSYQNQYADILLKLLKMPRKVGDSRIGKINSRFVETIRVDLRKEFPLMDIKWLKFSNILHELLWFVRGDNNIKYLADNECKIWNDDAYRYYNEKYVPLGCPEISKEDFIIKAMNSEQITITDDPYDKPYKYGDLDRIYGKQWREFNGKTDQLQNCIHKLKTNPDDRRMIISGHNPTDLEDNIVGLPSCHNFFQFYTEEIPYEEKELIAENRGCSINDVEDRYINVWFNIRSNDWFLGQPYNMPSYSILLKMIGKLVNMIPKEVVCTAIDTHLYHKHIKPSDIWLNRFEHILDEYRIGETGNILTVDDVTFCRSKLNIKDKEYKSINDFEFNDFVLLDYEPQPYIKAELLT